LEEANAAALRENREIQADLDKITNEDKELKKEKAKVDEEVEMLEGLLGTAEDEMQKTAQNMDGELNKEYRAYDKVMSAGMKGVITDAMRNLLTIRDRNVC
jgi:hypothetical protein